MLRVPTHVPEVPLAAAAMRRAAPRDFRANDALYVCHRAGRLPGFEVRVADDMDSDSIEELLEGMEDADEMVLAFNDAVEARERGEAAAVVATCEGTVVGYATFALEVDLEPLAACFDLAEVIHLDAHDADGYAQLEECVMNPVFAHARKTVVTEALRLLRKTCALYRLAPGDDQPPPPEVVTSDFRLVAGRRGREDFDAHFALFALTPRVAVTPRTAVNARVVVVGGSEAALATVDRLVTHPGTAFNNITLVTSGALAVGGAASAYNRASLAKLALENGGGDGGRGGDRRGVPRRARPRRARRPPRRRHRTPVRDVGGVPRARRPDPPRDGRRGRCSRRASARRPRRAHARGCVLAHVRGCVRRHVRGDGRAPRARRRRRLSVGDSSRLPRVLARTTAASPRSSRPPRPPRRGWDRRRSWRRANPRRARV